MKTHDIVDRLTKCIDLLDPSKPQPTEERHVNECFETLVKLRLDVFGYYSALTVDENVALQKLYLQCELSGNDGADVEEIQCFESKMTEQYGPFWSMTKEPN